MNKNIKDEIIKIIFKLEFLNQQIDIQIKQAQEEIEKLNNYSKEYYFKLQELLKSFDDPKKLYI